jgi:hypothetical protein
MSLSRRTLLGALAAAPFAPPARADAGWEGTWAAADAGQVLQVIVAGGEAIGLFWGGDYRTPHQSSRDSTAGTLTVLWGNGRVILSGRAGRTATATVHVGGRAPLVLRVRLD